MRDFSLFRIQNGITDLQINGAYAQKFEDLEIFNNVKVSRVLENKIKEDIKAPKVSRKNDLFIFDSGLDYARSDGLIFDSKSGVLDSKTNIFKGGGAFNFRQGDSKIKGLNVFYNANTKEVKGLDINASFFVK